jgi:hypothetical protein
MQLRTTAESIVQNEDGWNALQEVARLVKQPIKIADEPGVAAARQQIR